jgi:ABC-2 type transport system permease protein
MSTSLGRRYLTATRYALLEQLRNAVAIGLLIVFVPVWYYLGDLFTTSDELADFKFRPTGTFLHVSAHNLTLVTLGLNAMTIIVGFMLFSATRRDTAFDRRLTLSGYPQTLLILAKLTTLVLIAAMVSFYTSAVLYVYWRPGHPIAMPLIWLGFFCAALSYGALGLLLGVVARNELVGFFVVIMLSLIDTGIQNPLGNPAANQDIVKEFPSYAPTQIAVAGGFTHASPGSYVVVSLAWPLAFALLGLAIFWWTTRAWGIHTATAPRPLIPSSPPNVAGV